MKKLYKILKYVFIVLTIIHLLLTVIFMIVIIIKDYDEDLPYISIINNLAYKLLYSICMFIISFRIAYHFHEKYSEEVYNK